MSGGFLLATLFFHLLVLFAAGEERYTPSYVEDAVASGLCIEDMGTCDAKCKVNCNKKHPDGEGSCYTTLKGQNVCRCYYQCSNECSTELGLCNPQCDKSCCAATCADLYPGGEAYCDHSIRPFPVCRCHHACPP